MKSSKKIRFRSCAASSASCDFQWMKSDWLAFRYHIDLLPFLGVVLLERCTVCTHIHTFGSKSFRRKQKYPHSKFHRKGQYDEPWNENMVFPERIRLPMDRAIRYVDYLTRRKGNRAVPLESYSYYNHSGRRSTSPTATQDASWSQWLTDQWGYRVVQSFLEDPLTKQLREEAVSGSFYVSNIPFDSRYQESDQLQQDYNAGPPPFIQRILSRASNGEKPKPRNLWLCWAWWFSQNSADLGSITDVRRYLPLFLYENLMSYKVM